MRSVMFDLSTKNTKFTKEIVCLSLFVLFVNFVDEYFVVEKL